MSEFDDLKKLEMALAQRDALVKALEEARDFLDPDCGPPRKGNRQMVAEINAALASIRSTK